MGRPLSKGLDYFTSFLLDYDKDKTLFGIKKKYNLLGCGIIYQLLSAILKTNYYLIWNQEIQDAFSYNNHIDDKILFDCIKYLTGMHDSYLGAQNKDFFFDRELYKDHKALTSREIQEFYFFASKRRTKILVDQRYLLLKRYQETDADIRERLAKKGNRLTSREKLFYCMVDDTKYYLEFKKDQITETAGVDRIDLHKLEDDPGVRELLQQDFFEEKEYSESNLILDMFQDLQENLSTKRIEDESF